MSSADTTDGRRPLRRALVSVYDKTGLPELASALNDAGVAIVSTGSTAKAIAAQGVPVTAVEELTGFPECLDGRVKTLHPAVHAGILADTHNPDHLRQLEELGVEPFDLVVSNLYPFRDTVASGASPQECIEQIDIGGPSMVRAAAKNHASVAIVTSPEAYPRLKAALGAGGFTLAERQRLAAEAFVHTASYDNAVANWMGTVVADTSDGTGFPAWTGATWDRVAPLRYGENPHQPAALYRHWRPGIAQAEQLHGKEMSYNNYVDADAAVRAAHDHGDQPTVAIIKHANPCGIAVGETPGGGVRQGTRLRPPVGLRRHHRHEPDRHRRARRAHQGRVHRGHRRAGLRRRRPGPAARLARPSGCCACPPTWDGSATRSRSARSAAASSCRPPDRVDAVVRDEAGEPDRRRRRGLLAARGRGAGRRDDPG